MLNQLTIVKYFKLLAVSLLSAAVTGLAAALFLYVLELATQTRIQNKNWYFTLPIIGFIIGYVYHYYGKTSNKGNALILQAIKKPSQQVPFYMALFIFITTILTHLAGGSAGREGTAVQMGAGISAGFCKLFKLKTSQLKIMLLTGISAGFAGVFGTPIAAACFALEMPNEGKIKTIGFAFIVLCAWAAHAFCMATGITHSSYPKIFLPEPTLALPVKLIIASVVFGICAVVFVWVQKKVNSLFVRFVSYPPMRPAVGGLLLLFCFYFFSLDDFAGLGLPTLSKSFFAKLPLYFFIVKILLTALTLGSGFKGGEVTPLFFIGATLGSSLSEYLALPIPFAAAIGFTGVFASATKAPLACALMGAELFGWTMFPVYALVCYLSAFVSGEQGIYNHK
jgi:H+/Cl- antiporter ClcA